MATVEGPLQKEGSEQKTISTHEEILIFSTEPHDNSKNDTKNESIFVNEGLRRWERERQKWLNVPTNEITENAKKSKSLNVDVDEVIDLIFSNRWRQQASPTKKSCYEGSRFPHPVSLQQMVDILVDLWEAEGLDV
mmetsp:Transcript_2015/g.2870  ORF Transcript_2015/g.2870 Transcript_2015/m.2870 type:complete len:136 (-) Transcript_2015:416-823(-)